MVMMPFGPNWCELKSRNRESGNTSMQFVKGWNILKYPRLIKAVSNVSHRFPANGGFLHPCNLRWFWPSDPEGLDIWWRLMRVPGYVRKIGGLAISTQPLVGSQVRHFSSCNPPSRQVKICSRGANVATRGRGWGRIYRTKQVAVVRRMAFYRPPGNSLFRGEITTVQ